MGISSFRASVSRGDCTGVLVAGVRNRVIGVATLRGWESRSVEALDSRRMGEENAIGLLIGAEEVNPAGWA